MKTGSPWTGRRSWGGGRGPHGQVFVHGVEEAATIIVFTKDTLALVLL